MQDLTKKPDVESPLGLLRKQRSHVLFVLSNSRTDRDTDFLRWYQSEYRQAVLNHPAVLGARHHQRHEVDVSRGRWPPPPFKYLGFYELSLDGAEAAESLIERVTLLHEQCSSAEKPATWLYYPVSEKAGRSSSGDLPTLVVAFANGILGQEIEFREWYATRHIRHALTIPALVSGQCFELTRFQRPGALEAAFNTIAVYEQVGTPEEFLQGAAAAPKGTFFFPMLDLSRFAESAYRPLC